MRTMQILTLAGVSAILAMTVPASAQVVVGTQTIDNTNLAAVQAHCEALAQDPDHAGDDAAETGAEAGAAAGAGADAAASAGQAAGGAEAGAGAPAPGVASGNESVANEAGGEAAGAPAAEAGAGAAVNLDIITLEDCRAADLIEDEPTP